MEATATHPNDKPRDTTRDASNDFKSIRADVAQLAASVRKLAANELGSSVEDIQAKAGERISEAERAVRRNPTQAALIAAGVGFLVGLIMIR